MASSKNQLRFRLSFDLVLCMGCKTKRIRGVECSDCGARPDPWEIERQAAARRASIRATIDLLNASPSAVPARAFGPAEMEILLDRLHSWLGRFFSAIRSVSESTSGSDEILRGVVQELLDDRALMSAAPRRRPYIPLVDGARECVEHLVATVDSYLEALNASTPLGAQRHADMAQKRMDAAGDVLGTHSVKIGRLNDLLEADGFHDQMVVLLQHAMKDLEAADLTELSAFAEVEVSRIVGITPRHDHATSLQFAIQRALMVAYADSTRFERTVKESFELLSRNPTLLSDLAKSPQFISDFEAAMLDLFDASSQVAHAVDAGLPRQVGRSFVDIAASLVEGAGQFVAIAFLVVSGQKSKPYEKLRQDNSTELLRSARTRPVMAQLLEGFNLDLRTAQAHRMVRYLDDGVRMEIKSGPQEISWAELVDEIIMACESAMGCLVGLMLALSQLDLSLSGTTDYHSFGISPAVMLGVGLSGIGCEDVSMQEQEDALMVNLVAPDGSFLIALVACMEPLIPSKIRTLNLRAKKKDTWHVLNGPVALLAPLLNSGDSNSFQYGLASLRFQRNWTHNGQPLLSKDYARYWVGQQAFGGLSDGVHAISKLRTLRAFAAEIDDSELAESVTSVIRSTRLGDAVERQNDVLVAKLATWATTPVPFIPI